MQLLVHDTSLRVGQRDEDRMRGVEGGHGERAWRGGHRGRGVEGRGTEGGVWRGGAWTERCGGEGCGGEGHGRRGVEGRGMEGGAWRGAKGGTEVNVLKPTF